MTPAVPLTVTMRRMVSDLAPDDEHPYRGEELGGAPRPSAPDFAPTRSDTCCISRRWYPAHFRPHHRIARRRVLRRRIRLRIPGGLWPGFFALLFYGLGALLVLIDLIVLALMVMGYSGAAQYFKNALLTPGVVVSEKPLAVVILASLGNGSGPRYYGLQRLSLSSLPYHSNTPGTRVPAVCSFLPAEGLDRWLAFSPELICWGTGRRAKIEQCFERLGTEDFERLDACVAKGLIPKDDDELILLDEVDNKLATLSIEEEKKRSIKPRRADRRWCR